MGKVYFMSQEKMRFVFFALFAICIVVLPGHSWAEDTGFVGACNNVVGFFKNFETILKIASVSIVTIAVVFAGYQIAFAHKRLSDVAPILVGGLLIGGAATIAGWFVADWTSDGNAKSGTCQDNKVSNNGGTK